MLEHNKLSIRIKALIGTASLGAFLIIISYWLLSGGNHVANHTLNGETMGTTWLVKYKAQQNLIGSEVIDYEIKKKLEEINRTFSTYLLDSEVTQLNQARPKQWHRISPQLRDRIQNALEISELSNGYFDITVGSVVEELGFGSNLLSEDHSQGQQEFQREFQVGYQNIQLSNDLFYKSTPLKLDFSAIAKGFAVDEICNILRQYRIVDFMVEIGGEIRTMGSNFNEQPWQIAIENPTPYGQEVLAIVPIDNQAIASSGSYRNFKKIRNQTISHTIDPKTQSSISHLTIATTVISHNAEMADAWATAFMAMPREMGLKLANKFQNTTFC